MAIRKKLAVRVEEQIAMMPSSQFVVLDVTGALVNCQGKPLATNSEVSAIIRCHGLAKKHRGFNQAGRWKIHCLEKTSDARAQTNGDMNSDSSVKSESSRQLPHYRMG